MFAIEFFQAISNRTAEFRRFFTVFAPFFSRLSTVFQRFCGSLKNGRDDKPHARAMEDPETADERGCADKCVPSGDFQVAQARHRAVGDVPINCPCETCRRWFFRRFHSQMGTMKTSRGQSDGKT